MSEDTQWAQFEAAAPGMAFCITSTQIEGVGGDLRKIDWPKVPHIVVWDQRTDNAIVIRLGEGREAWGEALERLGPQV